MPFEPDLMLPTNFERTIPTPIPQYRPYQFDRDIMLGGVPVIHEIAAGIQSSKEHPQATLRGQAVGGDRQEKRQSRAQRAPVIARHLDAPTGRKPSGLTVRVKRASKSIQAVAFSAWTTIECLATHR